MCASSRSFPCSTSLSTSAAVNCLVVEAIRNRVAMVFGTCHSRLASAERVLVDDRPVIGHQDDPAELNPARVRAGDRVEAGGQRAGGRRTDRPLGDSLEG